MADSEKEKKIFKIIPVGPAVGRFKLVVTHRLGEPIPPDDGLNSEITLKQPRGWANFYPTITFARIVNQDTLKKVTLWGSEGESVETLKGSKINADPEVCKKLYFGSSTDALPPISLLERFISRFHRN